jgi:hypothetical protein
MELEEMKKLGYSIEFPMLEKIEDLIYYEGPLLSLFKRKDEDIFYFYYWIDMDKTSNRWLIFEVSQDDITNFKEKNDTIILKDLILKSNNLWIDDISDGLDDLNDLNHDFRYVEKKEIINYLKYKV